MNRCLKGPDYGCDFTVTQRTYQQIVNVVTCVSYSLAVCISGSECACGCICVVFQWTWQMCRPFIGGYTRLLLCNGNENTHTPPATFSPSLSSSCPPHLHNNPPPISPARAPMSKPNTTDQQLCMQIVSRDKLCAACQLHTWALGWLSVTCVRVPLHLCRATIMTWCRVSLQCTPTLTPAHFSVCPKPPFYPFTHSSTTPQRSHNDETVCHLQKGRRRKKVRFSGAKDGQQCLVQRGTVVIGD